MPQNGAAEVPAVPASGPAGHPGAASAAAPVAAPEPDYKALHAETSRKAAALEEKVKAGERERLDRLKADKAREGAEAERRRNPLKHFEDVLGPDWYDTATKLKAGTVTPGALTGAVSESEKRIQENVSGELKALRGELAELKADREERARQQISSSAAQHVTGNAEKYPLTNRYKQADSVGAFIEGHFKATSRRGEDGTWERGEMWSNEQAAAEVEKYWAGIRDMVLKSENGRQLPESGERPRLTIVPEQRAPEMPRDDDARRKAVDDAFARMAAKRAGQRAN